jgi:hypothetical protein
MFQLLIVQAHFSAPIGDKRGIVRLPCGWLQSAPGGAAALLLRAADVAVIGWRRRGLVTVLFVFAFSIVGEMHGRTH